VTIGPGARPASPKTSGLVCIHGHFYQPPRENPFTGEVELQPTAHPYPNWNARINAESYGPNLSAPILDETSAVVERVNNYEWISYDVGPTLLSWLESHDQETYEGIIAADRQSMAHLGGQGSAMAQSYNHTILPLSNDADRRTQIKWGIADFRHRYGRPPEGMWLPETAVDSRTLEILVDEGIEFTVLSPYQAAGAETEAGHYVDGGDAAVDSRRAYYVEPSPGKRIAVFFYDGPLSQQIAFGGLLDDGRVLARRLLTSLEGSEGDAALAHVATDGETYGHHHRFGEMALAAAIDTIRAAPGARLVNYASFLSDHPPRLRAGIVEDSSWSCVHGVERWRSDCGCSTGGDPGWHQEWRGPLRDALDWLRDQALVDFEASRGRLLTAPWEARDAYVEVLLGRTAGDFVDQYGVPGIDTAGAEEAAGLLEIQHRAMLMYTSCGWFFNDISGLETVFVLRQAGRVIDLMRAVTDRDPEPEFLRRLDDAVSNHPGVTGRDVYLQEVAGYMKPWPTS
jgi:alpha-amylase/alpha-mannosidase (GH57 family)